MGTSQKRKRGPKILRLHRILQTLRERLLGDSLTSLNPHLKSGDLALGSKTRRGIPRTENEDVHGSDSKTTQLRQMILCTNGRLFAWHRGNTIPRGGERCGPSVKKGDHAQITPDSLLLGHLHTHATEVRYLQKGTLGSGEIP